MSFKSLNIFDDIEINGRIYFIPDKYIEHKFLGIEYINLYKFVLASIINYNIENNILQNITKLSQSILNNYIQMCDKIFSYVITGKINNIHLNKIDNYIINKIPAKLIPNLNPNIVEKIE